MFGDYIWYKSDNFISFPIFRKQSTGIMPYIEGLAGLGLFLLISTFLVSTFSPQMLGQGVIGGAQSIFHLLATSTPILANSVVLTFISWGIIVCIIETVFFNGRLLEGLSTYAELITGKKVSLDKFSPQLVIVILVVAALFTLFHITAKGLSSLPLLITFVFSVISSILVLRHKELKGAILLHMATNSAAVAASQGWF